MRRPFNITHSHTIIQIQNEGTRSNYVYDYLVNRPQKGYSKCVCAHSRGSVEVAFGRV